MNEQSSGNKSNSVGVVPIETLRSMSGLEFFEGVVAGKVPRPPMSAVLRFDFVSAEKGFVVFKGEPASDFYNPLGSVHGGWTATLLDSCMGCAVHSMLEAGQGYTTIEFKINFVRPITDETGTLFAEGRIINLGRTVATAEGRLVDPSGKLYAHATTTCFILGR
jgi:uncharacterized protein (TIGR00369 family)